MLTLTEFSTLKLATWPNKLHHKCFHGVLKFLEKLISEQLQKDDYTVEEKTPAWIHLWKFQASRQLFSNPQPVDV